MAQIAHAELVGEPFRRNTQLQRGEGLLAFGQMRLTRLVFSYDDVTGEEGFHPAKNTHYPVETLRHIPLSALVYDHTWARPTLATALKEGASTRFVDTDAAVIARGGSLESLPKVDGFALKETIATLKEETERKKREVTYGPEVAAIFQGAKKHTEKTGGFFSARTPLDLVKARNRKKHKARLATIERKNREVSFP